MSDDGKGSVLAQAVVPVEEGFAKLGLKVEQIYDGTGLTRQQVREKGRFLDWTQLVAILRNCAKYGGGMSGLDQAGETGPRATANNWFIKLIAYFADSRLVFRAVLKLYIPKFFRGVSTSYEQLADGRLRIVIEFPETREGCEEFFHIWYGGFVATPAPLGQPDAQVEVEYGLHRSIYIVTPPPSATIVARIGRAWRVLFAKQGALEELAAQARQIHESYQQQLALRSQLVENEVKLKLAAQMTSLAKMSALGEMAGGVAHEINNPLMIVYSKAQILLESAKKGEFDRDVFEKSLTRICDTTMRMADIVRGLRAFSRNAEQDPMQKASVAGLVKETLSLCGEKFKNAGIEIKVEGVDPALAVKCRPTQVSQVLLNLLGNAQDAIEMQKDAWVRVEAKDVGPQIEIAVVDSGGGVSEKAQEKLFQPFFTTKEIGKGTGLGLSVSKGIIESHHGTLSLDTKSPNTRFVIRLPKAG